jgi:hypothetical protein
MTVNLVKIINNNVTIDNVEQINKLYGGYDSLSPSTTVDYFTGNRLNIISGSFSGTKVEIVDNFEFFNFTFSDPSAVGLKLQSGGWVNISDSVIENVNTDPSLKNEVLKVGDELVLIDADGASIIDSNFTQTKVKGKHGATIIYDFELLNTPTSLRAKVTSVSTIKESKSASEGFLGGLGLILQGSDHAASSTIEETVSATSTISPTGGGIFGGFGSASVEAFVSRPAPMWMSIRYPSPLVWLMAWLSIRAA